MRTDHVNITPRLSTTVYITSILLFPVCLHFLAIFPWVTIFGNVHRPCQWHPNIVKNFHIIFILILWLYSSWLPYLEMRTDHVDSTLTLSTTVYTMSILFLLIFPDFLTIFISVTIFGNVHRPCQEYPALSITVSSFFFWFFFSNFLAIFALITILGNAHRPCQQYPTLLITVYSFFPHFSGFSGYICINYHIRKCAQTM